jgi:hypothetical protein
MEVFMSGPWLWQKRASTMDGTSKQASKRAVGIVLGAV